MTTPIHTEADLVQAWQEYDALAADFLAALRAAVPDLDAYDMDDQRRIMRTLADNDPSMELLLGKVLEVSLRVQGHGRPSPLPPGDDEPLATVPGSGVLLQGSDGTALPTGLAINITTAGFRDFLHRQLAERGCGTYDAEHKRYEQPSNYPNNEEQVLTVVGQVIAELRGDDE